MVSKNVGLACSHLRHRLACLPVASEHVVTLGREVPMTSALRVFACEVVHVRCCSCWWLQSDAPQDVANSEVKAHLTTMPPGRCADGGAVACAARDAKPSARCGRGALRMWAVVLPAGKGVGRTTSTLHVWRIAHGLDSGSPVSQSLTSADAADMCWGRYAVLCGHNVYALLLQRLQQCIRLRQVANPRPYPDVLACCSGH